MKCPDCGTEMELISGMMICPECEMMNKTIEEESWIQGEDNDNSETD